MRFVTATELKNEIFRPDGRMVAVSFKKRDGAPRTIVTKRSDLGRFVNPFADKARSEASKRALERNPMLVRLMGYEQGGICRTIDLETVTGLKVNGETVGIVHLPSSGRFAIV